MASLPSVVLTAPLSLVSTANLLEVPLIPLFRSRACFWDGDVYFLGMGQVPEVGTGLVSAVCVLCVTQELSDTVKGTLLQNSAICRRKGGNRYCEAGVSDVF